MHRHILVGFVCATVLVGCGARTAVSPDVGEPSILSSAQTQPLYDERYRLWWEGTLYIDSAHERVDVVPRRDMHLHLNALKFLEEYCKNCLQITSILNNGDGTIDLTVRITHPFPGLPQYTGFDVKGIVMFQGSHEIPKNYEKYPLYPQNYRLSWRLMGDPELLNADGYSYRWSPWYDSGLPQPIFNYWEGRYAKGTPTANVNGYLNFYSHEERHMFAHDASVSRTYHIWLPPGPIVAGYAVEACWEPPLVKPVTNPVEDFPITANQPEAYRFKIVINDGNPVTDPWCCNTGQSTVHEARAEIYLWYLPPEHQGGYWIGTWTDEWGWCDTGCTTSDCEEPPEWRCFGPFPVGQVLPNGVHQLVGIQYHVWTGSPHVKVPYLAMDVYEIVIHIPD